MSNDYIKNIGEKSTMYNGLFTTLKEQRDGAAAATKKRNRYSILFFFLFFFLSSSLQTFSSYSYVAYNTHLLRGKKNRKCDIAN
jgi:hypothetical protein